MPTAWQDALLFDLHCMCHPFPHVRPPVQLAVGLLLGARLPRSLRQRLTGAVPSLATRGLACFIACEFALVAALCHTLPRCEAARAGGDRPIARCSPTHQ